MMRIHTLATASLLLLLLGACGAQPASQGYQAPVAHQQADSHATSPSSVSLSSSYVASSGSAPLLHTIGQVTWHAKNFLGTHVRVQGYLLKKENGYVIVSDETGGPLTRGDLPVTGSGIDAIVKGTKYILEGIFLGHGLAASNHNPDHLQLSAIPRQVQ